MTTLSDRPGVSAVARFAVESGRRMPPKHFAIAIALSSIALLGLAVRAGAQCSLFPLGGHVGIFGDLEGTETTIFFGDPPRPDTLHVLAILDGATSDGCAGVQFRIEVTEPEGWFLIPSFTADVQVGSVFDLDPNDPYNPAGVAMG